MKPGLILIFVVGLSQAAIASDEFKLTLTTAEVERLGVEVDRPRAVDMLEIAAGPAQVVIPPSHEAIVGAAVGGVISRLLVAEGEQVAAGQALAEVQSSALLAMQREYLDARASLELVQAQLRRDQGLFDDGIIAERRLQESAAAARLAAITLDQSRQELGLAGMTQAALRHLADEQALTSSLILSAPMDGVVIEQYSSLGARVNALEPVYRVADLRRLWIEVRVSEDRAEQIAPGFTVVANVGGRDVHAPVSHVGRVVDSTSQTVLVRAVLENENLPLRAGQYVNARVLANSDSGSVYVIPTSAVVWESGEEFIFVQTSDGFELLALEAIANDGISTYVSSGINDNTQIAVAGIAALKAVWFSSSDEGE